MKLADVNSSMGTLRINTNGEVVEVISNDDELKDYEGARFDLYENHLFWGEDPFEEFDNGYDILDLGVTLKDGTSEGPCKNARFMMLSHKLIDAGYEMEPDSPILSQENILTDAEITKILKDKKRPGWNPTLWQLRFMQWYTGLSQESQYDDIHVRFNTEQQIMRLVKL